MTKKPRLLLDVDGPLTSGFVDHVCHLLRQNGIVADSDAVRHWDPMQTFSAPDEVRARINDALAGPNVARGFVPRAGAVDLVRWARGHADVYAVTSPWDSPYWMSERTTWLVDHFEFNHRQVNHVYDKFIVAGDVLVDDKHANVVAWQESHPNGLAILFRMGHNHADAWPVEVSTCDGLRDLLCRRWHIE